MKTYSTSPKQLHIASWNVRSLTDDKPKHLAISAGAMGLDIVCLQETRRPETRGEIIGNKYALWCTPDDGTSNHGCGFLVHRDTEVEDFIIHKVINSQSRAAQIIVKTRKGRKSLYSLYAPHIGHGEDMVRQFWEEAADLPHMNTSVVGTDANGHVHPDDWLIPPTHFVSQLAIPPTFSVS